MNSSILIAAHVLSHLFYVGGDQEDFSDDFQKYIMFIYVGIWNIHKLIIGRL